MTQWRFDADVAKTFVDHARCHIPNYDTVISKSVDICKKLLTPNSAIIDVGCATGETLRQLSSAGFTNLTGVDASHAMLKYCDYNIAKIIHSDRFPEQKFDGVICNWTLHFIKNKQNYLLDIFNNLNTNGFLILSDKTSNDVLPIEFYHDFKFNAGVSVEDIATKAEQVKDIMYINDPEWYIQTLKLLGFNKVYIIDASWCFTTFIAIK